MLSELNRVLEQQNKLNQRFLDEMTQNAANLESGMRRHLKLMMINKLQGGQNMPLFDDGLEYEKRCKREKLDLGIPQEFKYDLSTDTVSMPYSAYKDLVDTKEEHKPDMKEVKAILKLIIKTYIRAVSVLMIGSFLACIIFINKGLTLYAIISAVIFGLTWVLPQDKDDLITLFVTKIKNYNAD